MAIRLLRQADTANAACRQTPGRNGAGPGTWTFFAYLIRTALACALLTVALVLASCGSATPTGVAAAATTKPTPTATAAPTATTEPTFADPLTSNASGWPTSQGSCEFANGGMQIHDAVCALPFFDAEDGVISVDAKATAGDPGSGFGLVWRAHNEDLYDFGVTANGTWGFDKLISGEPTTLDSGESAAIRQGFNVVNSLKVSFRGSHFELFVNDVKVSEEDDSSLASGVIGMFGGTAVCNNHAYFE